MPFRPVSEREQEEADLAHEVVRGDLVGLDADVLLHLDVVPLGEQPQQLARVDHARARVERPLDVLLDHRLRARREPYEGVHVCGWVEAGGGR